MEQDHFIASQIADFANNKSLYHKFLAEVSDEKLLVQQSAKESFVLVQIMIKAGLQLFEAAESFFSDENESLISRSLKAISFILAEHREILLWQILPGTDIGYANLWSWLISQLQGLLRNHVSPKMAHEVQTSITTILLELHKDRHSQLMFRAAKDQVLGAIEEASKDSKDILPHSARSRQATLLQLRLYLVLVNAFTSFEELEYLAHEPLSLRICLHGVSTLASTVDHTQWSTSEMTICTSIVSEIIRQGQSCLYDESWLNLSEYVLKVLPLSYSLRSDDIEDTTVLSWTVVNRNLAEMAQSLVALQPSLSRARIAQCSLLIQKLLVCPMVNLSNQVITYLQQFCEIQTAAGTHTERVSKPLAPVFAVQKPTKVAHPLCIALSDVLQIPNALVNPAQVVAQALTGFEHSSQLQQNLTLQGFGLLACANAKCLRQIANLGADRLPFACSVCDVHLTQDIQALPLEPSQDVDYYQSFLEVARIAREHQNTHLHIKLLTSWRRILHHTQFSNILDLGTAPIIRYFNFCLESESRHLRILTGHVLAEYFRYGNGKNEEEILQSNRRRIFDILRRHMSTPRLSESSIHTWVQLGLVARPDDLQLILLTIVDYLCSANMFIRQSSVAAIQNLAKRTGQSTYMLFSPYMRHISVQVLDRSQKARDFIAIFSRVLGVSASDFLTRNQQYLMPPLVLHGIQEHILVIAQSTKRDVKQVVLDNVPYILSSLMTSGYIKDGGLMRFLAVIEKAFESISLDELVNSYPIPLAVELLQLLTDKSVKRESVMAALSQVAHICGKVNSGTRKTPRDMALHNLKSFLQKHSLGIVSQCEECMNGYRGKRGFLDRTRYIAAIEELISLIQQGIEHAVPQVTAFLQTAMDEAGLRLSALVAWDRLICEVSSDVVGTLIPYSFCLFQSIWEVCTDFERDNIRTIFSRFFQEHQDVLSRQAKLVPRLRIADLQNVENELSPFRPKSSLSLGLQSFNQLVKSDNPIICEEGLRALKDVLLRRQAEVYSAILRDWKDLGLHNTMRNLLDIAARFKGLYPAIQLLAADCLGVIGAVDSVRQDAAKRAQREVILHNFEDEDAEESVKFVRIFLESQLINAFRTVTRSNVQIFLAWAIQELLKFSGLDSSVILLEDDHNSVHSMEAKKRWRMFSSQSRDVMTPLLSSKYDARERIIKVDAQYPIVNSATTYNTWLYTFLIDLLQSASGENAKKLFSVFSRILREEETVLSNFLLPYVFLNVSVSCSEEKRSLLLLEVSTVLEPRETKDIFQVEYTRLARESIFSIIDYLSLWTRSKKIYNRDRLAEKLRRQNRHMFPEDEQDKDNDIRVVQDLVNQIPSKLMAEAALFCGSYSRALFYWEQHIRTQSLEGKHDKSELEPLYAHLQQLYMHINDPDGIEGVSSCLTDLTLEQEILMHENAGRWTSAQNTYELALQSTPDRGDLRVGLLNCLKQTGHYEVLLDQATRFLQDSGSRQQTVLDMAIESSWSLGLWSDTKRLVDRSQADTYDVLLGRTLMDYISADETRYPQSIMKLKTKVITDLGLSNLDSTWQCFDSIAKLSVIHELEYHPGRRFGLSPREVSPTVMRDRLLIMPTTSPWKQHVLAVRRTLLDHDAISNRATTISSIWLESAKLARKAGQSQQAYKAILHALKSNGTPLAKIEHARWWWKEGHQIRAIQTLRKALDSGIFERYEPNSHDTLSSMDASLFNTGRTPKAALISKAELLLTRWNDLAEHANSKQQLKEYVSASRGSQLEKPHYFMGRYYLRLLEAETSKNPDVQDPEFLKGEYHRQVVLSYGRAMHFGVKYIFQTLPSYLQLWLDFGNNVRIVQSKSALTNASRQELIDHRVAQLTNMNEKIKGFVHRLPTYLYMLAFPQILSRINHTEKSCYILLESMILKCLVDYPKQALWPFMAVTKSRDSSRSSRGNTIIARLRKEATKSGNNNLIRLAQDAHHLTDQLMHLCTVPVIKNRASLSLTRDLEFDVSVAPSNLVVPIQNNLTVVLPAQGGVGSTKHHRAFEENQPTIASFKDEVDVMSSLQKPRKITIRASDGQNYPFLVKPNDDLRKDARLMDFNGVIQKFIRKDPEALKRLMRIRTYAVIALNEDHGLCEWVKNTRPLRDILVKTYANRNISMQYTEVKTRLEQCLQAPQPGQAFEVHVLKMFPPSFHDWFVEKFADPAQWFAARLSYSRTLAVMSMVGFVLGLGDRHGENILFDETSGDAVHVDFNCLFEKGHTFEKPEKVPFRLTHNMVDALGVTGVEGSFRRTCEITLQILRSNQDAFNTVLQSFLHDPVAEFLKKAKKSATGDFEKGEARKVLSVIANKLKGSAGVGIDKHTPLSIEGQADELIKQATDSNLLVHMYVGWTAWL